MSKNALVSTGISPSRRSVVRGAAWSVPVVAVAATAPAFAASPCDVQAYRLNWGATTYTPPSTTGAVRTATASVLPTGTTGGGALTVTFTSTVAGSVTRDTDNLTVSSETNIGALGAGERGLNISHADGISAGRANRQEIAISFNRAVTGLTFSITDIDSASGNWYDRVELTGSRTGTSTPRGANQGNYVLGDGTNVSETSNTVGPWRFYDNDTNVANTGSNRGNILVTYAGTIAANTPITLTYWSTVASGNQRVFLGDMAFNASGC